MFHDADSLKALQSKLAWMRVKRVARQWAIALPFLALPVLLPCAELSRSTQVKDEPSVVGPWMLRVKADPVAVGPWIFGRDNS